MSAENIVGTEREEDADVVIVAPQVEGESMFYRKMWNKKTGEFIPFGTYPNIDWS